MSWGILGTDGRTEERRSGSGRGQLVFRFAPRPRPSSAAAGGQADVTEVAVDGGGRDGRESTLNLTDTRDSLLTVES